MKGICRAAVAATLSVGLVSVAEAHVFVGVGIGVPVVPVMPMLPVAPLPVSAPISPIYYAPPPLVYAPPAYAPPVSLVSTDPRAGGTGTTDTATSANSTIVSTPKSAWSRV
jgi:hypothetical protein